MNKKILCLDFDGVLHSYKSGWQGKGNIIDPPVEGAYEFLKEAVKYFDVKVFSSRSKYFKGKIAMVDYCIDHFPDVCDAWPSPNDLSFPETKPPAHITIDDRAFCFEGKFPSIEYLLNFKPWNRR